MPITDGSRPRCANYWAPVTRREWPVNFGRPSARFNGRPSRTAACYIFCPLPHLTLLETVEGCSSLTSKNSFSLPLGV
eukprot:5906278-Amphidinium_carterae.1